MFFPLGAVAGILLVAAGWWGMHEAPSTLILPLGLPGLPFHLRVDALSSFFLLLLGSVAFASSIYSGGYFRNGLEAHALALLTLQYNVFLAGMALVLVADDAYSFLVAWEVMAVSSYFLVTTEHHEERNRRAGFVYLLMAHVGAVAILLAFGVLHGGAETGHGGYAFAAMREAPLSDGWRSVAFLLAFFGFGAKAGMLPLHIWLPDAHPAAPTPVSALMSGVMLKTAIYGMVRVTYDLIGHIEWQWGALVLLVGTATSLFGVLYALMQHDLKRLLAYHSVENIGIILIGLGLSLIFFGTGHPLAGGARSRRGPLPHAQSRGIQSAPVSRRRRGPARDRRARLERHGRAHPPHAAHGAVFPRRGARDLGAAATQRLRLRMAHLPDGLAGTHPGTQRAQELDPARRRGAGPVRGADRHVLREGLWDRVPGKRHGASNPRAYTRRASRSARVWPFWPRDVSCSGCFRWGWCGP